MCETQWLDMVIKSCGRRFLTGDISYYVSEEAGWQNTSSLKWDQDTEHFCGKTRHARSVWRLCEDCMKLNGLMW